MRGVEDVAPYKADLNFAGGGLLRFGHAHVLTVHRTVIHSARAASLRPRRPENERIPQNKQLPVQDDIQRFYSIAFVRHHGMPRTSSPTKGMCCTLLFSTKPLKIRKKFSLPLAKGIFLCYTIYNKIYLIKSNVVTGTMMLQQPAVG